MGTLRIAHPVPGTILDHVVEAPLKPGREGGGGGGGAAILDHVVEAPLKQATSTRSSAQQGGDPRPRGRGPIEATTNQPPSTTTATILDHVVEAPLKHPHRAALPGHRHRSSTTW